MLWVFISMPTLCFLLPHSRQIAYRFHTQTISWTSSNLISVFFSRFSLSHLIQHSRVPKPFSSVALSPAGISLIATSSCICGHLLFASSSLHLPVFVHLNNTWPSFSSPQRRHLPLSVPRSPLSITIFPTCAPLCHVFHSPGSTMYTPLFLRSSLYKQSDLNSLIPLSRLCLWMSLRL